jgi:beta-lactamase superfamily II metal-dependent hydrolase
MRWQLRTTSFENHMKVITPYVGQGSLSIIVGEKEAIIVDTFVPPSTDDEAVFMKDLLAKVLQGKNVVGLLLTGLDCDHADPRGVAWILGMYRPTWVMYPCYKKLTGRAGQVFKSIKTHDVARANTSDPLVRHSIRLDRIDERKVAGLSAEWEIEVFSPHPEDMTSSNNCSLVALVEPKEGRRGFRYLITGDTENPRWENINRIFGKGLRAEVMAAPHHGSRNGINAKTLDLVEPERVLISAGRDNKFGHPHREAIDLYEAAGATVHSTHGGKSYQTSPGLFWGANTEEWSLNES